MALGIQTEANNGESFLGIIKYDARAGRFFRVDRAQDGAGNWQKTDVDITQGISFVLDFENIEVGYMSFAGGVPDFQMVPLGKPLPVRPAGVDDKGKPSYKQGFRAKIKLAKSCGGDVREFSHSAKVVLGEVDKLHNTYAARPRDGKLPVIACKGAIPVKSGQSTNYAPILEIVDWIPRPAELSTSAQAGAPAAAQPAPTQASAPSYAPPPPAQAAPASSVATDF